MQRFLPLCLLPLLFSCTDSTSEGRERAGGVGPALMVSCDIFNLDDGSDVSLHLSGVLAPHFGSTNAKQGVSLSHMVLVDGLTNKLLIADDLSHLNTKSTDGSFNLVKDTLHPIGAPVEAIEVRELKFKVVFKPEAKPLELIDVAGIKPTFPDDNTFTGGETTIKIAGKTRKKLATNCGVYKEYRGEKK